jgi:hypothetical protein
MKINRPAKPQVIKDFEAVIWLSPRYHGLEFRHAWASFTAGLERPVRLLTYSANNGKAVCYSEFVQRYAMRFGGCVVWEDRLTDGRFGLYARPLNWGGMDDRSF